MPIVAGLDPNLQSKVHEMGAEDLEDALRTASRCERARAVLQLTTVGYPHSQSSEQVAMVRPKSTDDKLLHVSCVSAAIRASPMPTDY